MAESADRVAIAFDPAQIRKAQDRNPFVKISDIVYDILSEAILSSTIGKHLPKGFFLAIILRCLYRELLYQF